MTMILLDTNVLMYAIGRDHPFRPPCRRLMDVIGAARIDAHVTDVVLVEFLHARARRTSRREAAERAADIAGAMASVLPVSDVARATAFTTFAGSRRLSSHDALIAAVALEYGAQLVTADDDFSDVPGLECIAPGGLAFEDLIGGRA